MRGRCDGTVKPTTCGSGANFAGAPAGPYVEPGCTVARPNAQTLYGTFSGANGQRSVEPVCSRRCGVARPQSPEVVNGEIRGGWCLELLPSTAAGVEVSGRVLTPDGRGLQKRDGDDH